MLARFQQVDRSEIEMFHLGSISPSQVVCNYLCLVMMCVCLCFYKESPRQIQIVQEVSLICNKKKSWNRHWDLDLAGFIQGF